MTEIHDDYWTNQFDITQDDLNRIADRFERTGVPQDLKSIALPIIKGRLEYGHDFSPAVIGRLIGKPSVRLWDPTIEWKVGDIVLVAHDRFGNLNHEAFLGEIVFLDQECAEIKIEELQSTKTYNRTLPGTRNAQKHSSDIETWRTTLRDSVEKKLQSSNLNEKAEGILLRHGEHILSRLAETLHSDSRFTNLEDKWFVGSKLPRMEGEVLSKIHLTLLHNPASSEDELLSIVKENATADVSLLRMAVHTTLQQSQDRFMNIGTPSRPLWKALLPEPDQAKIIFYAYDPQTYEIICRPGQGLTKKKALRLKELDLYSHVVTFVT